jgi:hypothetical protein
MLRRKDLLNKSFRNFARSGCSPLRSGDTSALTKHLHSGMRESCTKLSLFDSVSPKTSRQISKGARQHPSLGGNLPSAGTSSRTTQTFLLQTRLLQRKNHRHRRDLPSLTQLDNKLPKSASCLFLRLLSIQTRAKDVGSAISIKLDAL